MTLISKMKYMYIYSNMQNGYIVHNTKKEFKSGHTHLNNFSTAKYIAYLALYKRLPKKRHLSPYLIESVIRISDDPEYTNKMIKFRETQNKKSEGG